MGNRVGVDVGGTFTDVALAFDGEPVPAKASVDVVSESIVSILTPGGGSHDDSAERDSEARERDRRDGKWRSEAAVIRSDRSYPP